MNWTEESSIWNIACTDNNGNIQESETRTINIDTIIPTTILNINPNPAEYQTGNIEINWNVNDLNKESSIIEISYPNGTIYITSTNETINVSISKLKLYTVGDYSVHIFGNDSAGNSVDTYENLTITDTIKPSITSTTPENSYEYESGTGSTILELLTDENSICKYSNQYLLWENMTQMNYTGSNLHSQTIAGLNSGNSYTYYFMCEDLNENRMDNTHNLTFSVKSASQNPSGGGGGGGGGGTTETVQPIIQEETGIPTIPPQVEPPQENNQQENNNQITGAVTGNDGLTGITGSAVLGQLKKKSIYIPLGVLAVGALSWGGIAGTRKLAQIRKLKKVQFKPNIEEPKHGNI